MTEDREIGLREAIAYFKGDLRAVDVTEIHQLPLVALAERYLELAGKCEELTGDTAVNFAYGQKVAGYNEGRRDALLAVMGGDK